MDFSVIIEIALVLQSRMNIYLVVAILVLGIHARDDLE